MNTWECLRLRFTGWVIMGKDKGQGLLSSEVQQKWEVIGVEDANTGQGVVRIISAVYSEGRA